jgi:carbon-monoxide dehydrogenase iron sulfur subunit
MEKHLMAIPNRCTGCNRCVYACSATKEGMFMPSKARVHVSNFAQQGYSVPNICFQCPKAACMEACPSGAIYRSDRGVVVVDAKKCDGCGDCVMACPYGMIDQYASGRAFKCDLCGGAPACAAECHYGALIFREVDKVSQSCRKIQMKQRIPEGQPQQKRRRLALNVLKQAIRVPRTPGYMG